MAAASLQSAFSPHRNHGSSSAEPADPPQGGTTRRTSRLPQASGTSEPPGRTRQGHPARNARPPGRERQRSEEHTSELQSRGHLVCRLLLEKKKETRETANR